MFQKINYNDLNPRQQENYNFHKLASLLADYGFTSMKLSDDWQGADFIAYHINGIDFLKVQLKGRLTINKKYSGKNIHIGFLDGNIAYLYPHDYIRDTILKNSSVGDSESWVKDGSCSWPRSPKWAIQILEEYKLV